MHILSGVMTISVVLKHLEDQLASTYEPTALCQLKTAVERF